ncbi:hypothetical protein HDR59_03450 [bacterium]|nr:hypothetical protein [bacterium]
MNKAIIIFTGIIILSLGIYSSRLQYRINDLQNEISKLEEMIKNSDVEIRVLETEISHLTSISKIKPLSNKYLKNYHNINKNDFIRIVDIPINPLFE